MNATIKIDTDAIQKLIDDFNSKLEREDRQIFLNFILETEMSCEDLKGKQILRMGNMAFLHMISVREYLNEKYIDRMRNILDNIYPLFIVDKFVMIDNEWIDNPLFDYILDVRKLIHDIRSHIHITSVKENQS